MSRKRQADDIQDLYKKLQKIQKKLDIIRAVPESSSTDKEEEQKQEIDRRRDRRKKNRISLMQLMVSY